MRRISESHSTRSTSKPVKSSSELKKPWDAQIWPIAVFSFKVAGHGKYVNTGESAHKCVDERLDYSKGKQNPWTAPPALKVVGADVRRGSSERIPRDQRVEKS